MNYEIKLSIVKTMNCNEVTALKKGKEGGYCEEKGCVFKDFCCITRNYG
jgi:hypothetical protein